MALVGEVFDGAKTSQDVLTDARNAESRSGRGHAVLSKLRDCAGLA